MRRTSDQTTLGASVAEVGVRGGKEPVHTFDRGGRVEPMELADRTCARRFQHQEVLVRSVVESDPHLASRAWIVGKRVSLSKVCVAIFHSWKDRLSAQRAVMRGHFFEFGIVHP